MPNRIVMEMATEGKTVQTYSVQTNRTGLLITPRRIGMTLFILLCVAVGSVALLVEPIYVAGVLIATLFTILIFLYPYFGLLVFFVDLVVSPAVLWPQLGVLHPDALLGATLLTSVIFHKKFKGEPFIFFRERMSWMLVFFLAAMVASVPTSVWPSNSVTTIVDFLTTIIYYLLIINVVTTEKRLKGLIWLFILAGGYNAISSAIAYFKGDLMVAQGIERAESLTGADPNTLAVSLVLAIPFMAFALGWTKAKYLRLFSLLLAAASIFTVAITGSRSGVIGLLAVMFFIWINSKNRLVTLMIILVSISFGWMVLPAQYKERYSTITSGEVDASTQGRYDAWNAGMRMFWDRPFLGVGTGNFSAAYGSGNYSKQAHWLKPHNMYVQIISELGIVGIVTFGGLIWFMIRQNFRLRKRMRERGIDAPLIKAISYSITCSTGALFFTCIFGHSLFRTHWYWCCALTVVLWALFEKALPAAAEPVTSAVPGNRNVHQRAK